MMKYSYGFSVVLLSAAVVIVQHQVTLAQTAAEVNTIAKQITVRIDGKNTGSGVIINRLGNTYTVLTNEHVVRLNGSYTIQTLDGRRYNFNQSMVKYFSGVDLAVLQFNSTQNYRTPELGNSQKLSEGTTIYVAGWSDSDAVSPESSYTFLPGGISRIVKNAKNGYALVYTNPTKPGMSGGPVLDTQGRLVGINGLSLTNPGTGATDYFGIPINTYQTLSSVVVANPQLQAPSIFKLSSDPNENLKNGIARMRQASLIAREGITGDTLFALGSAHFQQQKYQEAIGDFQAGLRLKPNDSNALFNLGNAYYVLGKFPDAITQYNKAVSFNRQFWPPVHKIGLILYEQGDTQGAIKQWQAAIAIEKAAEPALALAVALYTIGERQQGLAAGEAALRIDKKYGDLDFLKQNLWGKRLLADTKKFLEKR